MGNPNVVIFVDRDPLEIALDEIAATVAQWNVYDTEPNVEVVKAAGGELFMRVRERGAGETWACGTGACAAAAATILTGRATSPVKVSTQGGTVSVDWPGAGHSAVLTGDAQLVFRTQIELAGT
jgi:diaminopimelate epimerase